MARKSKFDLAKEIVPTLTQDELYALKHHIDFFYKAKGKFVDNVPRTGDILLYESLKSVLSRKLNTRFDKIQFWIKKHPRLFGILRKRSDLIEAFIEDNFKKDISKIEKNRLYIIFINVVADRIELTRVPLSLTSTLSFLNNLPGLVDKAFPGYIQSGMLDALIQARE